MAQLYQYLKATDANLNSTTKDNNNIEVHTINLANSNTAIYTEAVGFYAGEDIQHRLVAVGNITGTANATLQSSFEGFNDDNVWFNTEKSDGNNIVITLDSNFTAESYHDVKAFGNFQRWKFDGTNTTGNLKVVSSIK